uniref:Uncharacterized protein n=1 Tax=Leersia perrieri TaxID=77586 RepID=A0A0D9VFP6_9ORYZ
MVTFSVQAQQWSSSGQLAAAASQGRQRSSSLSWRSSPELPRRGTMQCRKAQQKLSASAGVAQEVGDDRLSKNPCDFHPSIWGDFFLHHSSPAASSEQQVWTVQVEKLKEEVANMITTSVTSSLLEKLHLIDSLERICVDYLFQEEINSLLTQISTANINDCNDVHTVAMWFYLLRKHGYNVSQDVFAKFKDGEGNFVAKNPLDLLTLYNAAHYRVHGEKILDEAILFTKRCLNSMLPSLEGSLAREVKSALEIPLPRRVAIYEANYYISTYEKEGTVHPIILQLAKLNFNLMQIQYQEELEIATRWWNDLEIQSKLPFARDRIVECYLWMLGVYYEPSRSCSRGRVILTKVISIATIFDDTFDSYGTIHECELFTKCLQSWEQVADDLPDCMKHVLRKVFESYQTIEHELSQQEKYRMPYLRSFTADLVKNYNKEVKMREEGYVPKSVEEHLQISARTGACHLLACASLVGMDDMATKESFDWVSTMPKMVQALCTILRLVDDLETYEREQLTPHVASSIDSYRKQHNVSMEIARFKIEELKEEFWKDFNDEWLYPENGQPRKLLEAIFNLTRTMEFMYNQNDNFTYCHYLKDTIRSLLVEAFPVLRLERRRELHNGHLHLAAADTAVEQQRPACLCCVTETTLQSRIMEVAAAALPGHDVFAKFKYEEGYFAVNNPRDLLSLYNAAYLGTHGETILDEAISFTRRCLESTIPNLEGLLAHETKCALDIPLPRRVRIYEAKDYIFTYEREHATHEVILELAKLNSNIMQLHYQEELKIVSRWWKDLEVESRVSFARDRIVECYYWITIDLVRAFNAEVKWRDARYVPATVDEHLHISMRSGGRYLLSCALFVGMDHVATPESFIWVSRAPKIIQALCKILRLSDDLETYEREQVALHVASTINSYMKEHNVPIENGRGMVKELIEDTWKDFNQEWLTLGNVQPKQLLERPRSIVQVYIYTTFYMTNSTVDCKSSSL